MRLVVLLVVLIASVEDGSPVPGQQRKNQHELRANQEVRTIVSAIVDAILDGDRERRSEVVDTNDDDHDENFDPSKTRNVIRDRGTTNEGDIDKLTLTKREETEDQDNGLRLANVIATSDLNATEDQSESLEEIFKKGVIATGSPNKKTNDNIGSASGLNNKNSKSSRPVSLNSVSVARLPDTVAKMVDDEELASSTRTKLSSNSSLGPGFDQINGTRYDNSSGDNDDDESFQGSQSGSAADAADKIETESGSGDKVDESFPGDDDDESTTDDMVSRSDRNNLQDNFPGEFDNNSTKMDREFEQNSELEKENSWKTSEYVTPDVLSNQTRSSGEDIGYKMQNGTQSLVVNEQNGTSYVAHENPDESHGDFASVESYQENDPTVMKQVYNSWNSSGLKSGEDWEDDKSVGEGFSQENLYLSGKQEENTQQGLEETTGKQRQSNVSNGLVSMNSSKIIKNQFAGKDLGENKKNMDGKNSISSNVWGNLQDKHFKVNEKPPRSNDINSEERVVELKESEPVDRNWEMKDDAPEMKSKDGESLENKTKQAENNSSILKVGNKESETKNKETKLDNSEMSDKDSEGKDSDSNDKDSAIKNKESELNGKESGEKVKVSKSNENEREMDDKVTESHASALNHEHKINTSSEAKMAIQDDDLGKNSPDSDSVESQDDNLRTTELKVNKAFLNSPDSEGVESQDDNLGTTELKVNKAFLNSPEKEWGEPQNKVISFHDQNYDELGSNEDLGNEGKEKSGRDDDAQKLPETLFIGKGTNPEHQSIENPENSQEQWGEIPGNDETSTTIPAMNGQDGYPKNDDGVSENIGYTGQRDGYLATNDMKYAGYYNNRLDSVTPYVVEGNGMPVDTRSAMLAKRNSIPGMVEYISGSPVINEIVQNNFNFLPATRDDVYRLGPELSIRAQDDASRQQPELSVQRQENKREENKDDYEKFRNDEALWQKRSDTANPNLNELTKNDPVSSILGDVGEPWIKDFLTKTLKMAVNGDPYIKTPTQEESDTNVKKVANHVTAAPNTNDSVERLGDSEDNDVMPADATNISDDDDDDVDDEDEDYDDSKQEEDEIIHVKTNTETNYSSPSNTSNKQNNDMKNNLTNPPSSVVANEKPMTSPVPSPSKQSPLPAKSTLSFETSVKIPPTIKIPPAIVSPSVNVPPPVARQLKGPMATLVKIPAPAPAPFTAPVPASVKPPAASKEPALVKFPAPIPAPFTAKTALPVPQNIPARASSFVPSSLSPPAKLPVPVTAPFKAPIPFLVKAPLPAPVKARLPAPVKAPLPAPFKAPLPSLVKAPLPAPVNVPLPAPVKVPAPAPALVPAAAKNVTNNSNILVTNAPTLSVEKATQGKTDDQANNTMYIGDETTNSEPGETGILNELNKAINNGIQNLDAEGMKKASKESKLLREIKATIPIESQRPANIDSDLKEELEDLKDYASALAETAKLPPAQHNELARKLASGLMDEMKVADTSREELLKKLMSYVTSIEIGTVRERLYEVRAELLSYATTVSDDPTKIRGEAIRLLDDLIDHLPLPVPDRLRKQNELLNSKLLEELIKEGKRRALREKLKKALLDLVADKLL